MNADIDLAERRQLRRKRTSRIIKLVTVFTTILSVSCFAVCIQTGVIDIKSIKARIFPNTVEQGTSKTHETTPTISEYESAVVKTGKMDTGNAEEIRAGLQKKVDESYVTHRININPVFTNAKAKGNLMIENIKENNFIVQVEYEDDITKEIVYTSPPLRPGEYIQEDVLLKEYSVGTHDVIAYFNTYNLETEEFVNRSGFKLKITILK